MVYWSGRLLDGWVIRWWGVIGGGGLSEQLLSNGKYSQVLPPHLGVVDALIDNYYIYYIYLNVVP